MIPPAPISVTPCPEQWSDELLLARILLRDHLAWREFHRRFDRLVYRCIHRVTARFSATVSREDVREIYSHFLLGITQRDMHKLRTFDAARGSKLSSWVGMLATNAAWDHVRAIARQPQTIELANAEEVFEEADPCEHLLMKERWVRIDQTLRAFSLKDRTFVRLYYVDGLSPEEVAEEMSISIKTVYSKKHKIRCRLQQMLQPVLEAA